MDLSKLKLTKLMKLTKEISHFNLASKRLSNISI